MPIRDSSFGIGALSSEESCLSGLAIESHRVGSPSADYDLCWRREVFYAALTVGLNSFCRREEAVFLIFGWVQADVKIVIAGRDDSVIRNKIAVLVSDFRMISRPQNNHVAIRAWCNGDAGNPTALARQRVTVTAGRRISPAVTSTVRRRSNIMKCSSRSDQACQTCHALFSDRVHQVAPRAGRPAPFSRPIIYYSQLLIYSALHVVSARIAAHAWFPSRVNAAVFRRQPTLVSRR